MATLTRHLRRGARCPGADEQAAKLVVARESLVVANDGDVVLDDRQIA
jgi:hypothetical protein